MNNATYMRNLVVSFFDENSPVTKIFLQHFDSLNLDRERILQLVGPDIEDNLIYHSFSDSAMQEPYEPFLGIIKEYYLKYYADRYSVTEFCEETNVYFSHKCIFESYIEKGSASRIEPIIVSDFEYEYKKMIESLVRMLCFISKEHKLYIALNNFKRAGLGTINIVEELLRCDNDIRLMIVYSELSVIELFKEESFKRVIQCAEDKMLLYECEGADKPQITEASPSFCVNKSKLYDDIKKLNNMYFFLDAEDAEYYMHIIYDKLVGEKYKVSDKNKFYFIVHRILTCILLKKNNTALFMSDNLIGLFDPVNDMRDSYVFNYVNCMAQMSMNQTNVAYKYAEECKRIATRIGDKKLELDAEVLGITITYGGWRDVFSVDFQNVSVDENIVKHLEEEGYYNTLTYYCAYGRDNDTESIKQIVEGRRKPAYEYARKICEVTGNMNAMLSIYTKNTVMFTDKGYHNYVNRFYEEKFVIHKKENDTRRMANLLLGMGYNAIIGENSDEAMEYFGKAIEILYDFRQPEAIAEALYNMSMNCICELDYENGSIYLNAIFRMLLNLGIETLQICNSSKLNGLLALCYYRLGNEYRSYTCLNKMKMTISHLLDLEDESALYQWHEDLFLYYFVNGMLKMDNGEDEEAVLQFKKAEYHYESYPGAKFYCVVNFTTESVKLFRKIGEYEKAEAIRNNAIKYCEDNGYMNKAEMIKCVLEGKDLSANKKRVDSMPISLDALIELSHIVGKEKEVDERKKDINFLSSWQEMLYRDDYDIGVLVSNAMSTLQNNFNLDNMLMVEKSSDGTIRELFRNNNFEVKGSYQDIFDFFVISGREFIAHRTKRSFKEYKRVVGVFDESNIVTMVGVPINEGDEVKGFFIGTVNMHSNFRRNRVLLNNDNLVVIKTAMIQLYNGLERIKNKKNIESINERLKEIAITDNLTGLYNRQGFSKMIEEKTGKGVGTTILYVDLDNFKYYNDTFGHEIGDLILVNFARIFKDVIRTEGYAVRYGGDEFLIVLDGVMSDKAVDVAERIYSTISDGFEKEISIITRQDVHIPDNKKVSCSIGIATTEGDKEEDINEVLRKADEALYFIKRHEKGRYMLWEDV